MATKRIAKEIAKGMALLDQKGPEDWRGKIECDTLDMQSCFDCILGQLYGEYADGLQHLTRTGETTFARRHGFEVTMNEDEEDGVTSLYAQLDEAWRQALGCEGERN